MHGVEQGELWVGVRETAPGGSPVRVSCSELCSWPLLLLYDTYTCISGHGKWGGGKALGGAGPLYVWMPARVPFIMRGTKLAFHIHSFILN